MNSSKNRSKIKSTLMMIHHLRKSPNLKVKVHQMKVSQMKVKQKSHIKVTLMRQVNYLQRKKVGKTIKRNKNKSHQSMVMKMTTMSLI